MSEDYNDRRLAFKGSQLSVGLLSQSMDIIISILRVWGACVFVFGSICFYPRLRSSCYKWHCPMWGALLFLLGSSLWLVASIMSLGRSYRDNERGRAICNACIYIVADLFYIIGSVFFIPAVIKIDGMAEGIASFVIGSVLLVFAPLYNILNAYHLRQRKRITWTQFCANVFVVFAYITGSILFIVGCIYFIPNLYHEFAVTLFVVGSLSFLCGTLAALFAGKPNGTTIISGDSLPNYAALSEDSESNPTP